MFGESFKNPPGSNVIIRVAPRAHGSGIRERSTFAVCCMLEATKRLGRDGRRAHVNGVGGGVSNPVMPSNGGEPLVLQAEGCREQ